jgi:tyrosyl-tRNA synthetase
MTLELITTASGEKFGKSAGNAVWLDASRTSPWELFQFMVTQDDGDVVKLLKLFTFLSDEEIAELEASTENEPNARKAQRKLAVEVTAFIHGRETALEMERAAAVMFGAEITGLSEATLETVFASVPTTEVKAEELAAGVPLSVLLARTGLAGSLTKARQFISGGGAYINNVRAQGDVKVDHRHLATSRHIVLRIGKKSYHVLKVVG